MPDGTRLGGVETPEAEAVARDQRLISAVGLRLVLWAAGTTLVVLVILGVALYVAVGQSLATTGVRQLEDRAESLRHLIEGPAGRPPDDVDLPTGLRFGGGTSGTLALVLREDGKPILPRNGPEALIKPDVASVAAATASGRDVRLGSLEGTPVRILTTPVSSRIGTVYVQIFQDRTAEERTLGVLLTGLLGGGIVVLLVAAGVGVIYSRRALVPIRSSLASQRQALRRQREFAADASHELRTPLTVIRSSLDLLHRQPDAPVGHVGDALDDIGAEVDNLTRLVEDLLLLARTDSGAVPLERLPIDLGDAVSDAAASMTSAADQRGVLISVEAAPAEVRGDAARLRQLVLILVDNAIRHSAAGAEVRVSVRADGAAAVLVVEDDGPGIREEDLGHVFERFWRGAGAPAGGSGLGLAIASWIVDGHDGEIQATNGDPVGAKFTVRIPLDRGIAPA